MKRLCVICARGGSKGLKNKNIRYLLGKPLLVHSIFQAKSTKLFDMLAVSSDSEDILSIARDHGTEILIRRPAELASDEAPKLPVIKHCVVEAEKVAGYQFDVVVDLDVTSPLRVPEDIVEVLRILEGGNVSNVITGTPARRSPYFNLVELDSKGVVHLAKPSEKKIERRQDSPKCYDMNASIYAWERSVLFNSDTIFLDNTFLHIMPKDRSVDIDDDLDFELVELILKRRQATFEESV